MDQRSFPSTLPPAMPKSKEPTTINTSWLSRILNWIQKPIEQKIFGFGGRKTAFTYARWVKSHRFDFDGVLHPHELLSVPSPSLAHSTHYLVSDVYSLKLLLDEVFTDGTRYDAFLDIGCGKGMPALYAQKFYAFKESLGMDFSERLVEAAQGNLKKSGQSSVRFLQADAADFKIPPQRTVVYLHNPFGPELLKTFLTQNLKHFQTQDSILAYAFDIHRHILPELGFEVIYRSQRFSHSLWRLRA